MCDFDVMGRHRNYREVQKHLGQVLLMQVFELVLKEQLQTELEVSMCGVLSVVVERLLMWYGVEAVPDKAMAVGCGQRHAGYVEEFVFDEQLA